MAQLQLHPRRHVFHGHASGVSAHFRRPETKLLPVQGSVSLPVTGGLAESNLKAADDPRLEEFKKWISFDSVSTSAHGDYVDAGQGVATTRGEVAFDAAPTVTRVRAAVRGLVILGRLKVDHAAMGLTAHSAVGRDQPAIRPEGNILEGVSIDGFRLAITLAEDLYSECDTKDKLARRHGSLSPRQKRMFLPAADGVDEARTFPDANGTVKCSIVQEIRWDGPAHPTATIHDHVVEVPDFGKIYFGEMFIKGDSRRLTMVRCQLGSPDGGEVAAAEGEPNPGIFPP
jgi:hypothetical protein